MQVTNTAIDVLNRLLHDTVNSVVQYAEIAAPYVPPDFDAQLAEFNRVSDEEKALANECAALLDTRDGVPTVGIFPFWNVDLNYLDLRFLAKFAAQHQEKVIAHMERELDLVNDDPEVLAFVKIALEQKKEHLSALLEVAGDY